MKDDLPAFTRKDITKVLCARLSISAKDAKLIVEAVKDSIAEVLEEGRQILIPELGRFYVRVTVPRPGRNPRTGAYAEVPPRRKPCFALSRTLRERMLRNLPERPGEVRGPVRLGGFAAARASKAAKAGASAGDAGAPKAGAAAGDAGSARAPKAGAAAGSARAPKAVAAAGAARAPKAGVAAGDARAPKAGKPGPAKGAASARPGRPPGRRG